MKKRILAAVLSMALAAACLTACGDSASTADAEKTESSSSQAQSESVADSESKTESGADSESKADSKAESSSDSDSSNAEEKQEEKEVLLKEETYDSKKQLTEYTTYTYEYDEASGHYIRNAMHATLNNDSPATMNPETPWGKDEYDKDMKLLAKYDGKTGKQTYKYEYDGNGNRIKYTRFDETTGNVLESAQYEYNADGNCVKEIRYNDKGEIDVTTTREYSDGKKIREKNESKAGGYDNVYTYNEKGDVIRVDTTAFTKTTYDEYSYDYYDDGGYKKTYKRFVDGKNVGTQMDTYDSKGNQTLKEVVNGITTKYYYGKLPK
ncbi:MAG: hypothetical protein ILA17_05755 [Ruminococcus sp.]|nr:hypothetical protein [Ruminococcus sp.]